MKKLTQYIASLVLGAAALSSCSDSWEQPPLVYPTFPEGFQANTTIADLKTAYWQENDAYGAVVGQKDGQDIWICGKVVSSTASGNIYKTLVLQDATGAITIGLDTTKIETVYPMGFEVAVNVTGLCIGRYNGLMQLGMETATGVNRIANVAFQPHTKLNMTDGLTAADTATVTIPEIVAAGRTTEGKIQWQSRLVRIDSVKFVEAGEPFAVSGTNTSRNIIDSKGNKMVVYNSPYSTFAYDAMPYGTGSVVGILSCYRTTWQLVLIDAAGCIAFDGKGAPDPNQYTVFSEPFGANSQGNFTIDNVFLGPGLDKVWQPTASYGMKASAFVSGNIASDSYLISPVLDLTGAGSPMLRFSHCVNKFTGDPAQQVSVNIREEGATEWTALTIPTFSSNADWNFAESGDISLDAFAGKKVQIAFRYTSTTESTGTWEVKNVVVTAIKNK